MSMSVDQSRECDFALGIDLNVRRTWAGLSDLLDLTIVNENGGIPKHIPCSVLCNDPVSVLDE